jgi:hypothetical protein
VATTLILSHSYAESNEYAKEHGLHARHATTQAARAGGYQHIVELPSFMDRPDRFAVRAAIKKANARILSTKVVAPGEWIRPKYRPQPPKLEIDPAVFLMTDIAEVKGTVPSTEAAGQLELPYETGADGVPDGLSLAELAKIPIDANPGEATPTVTPADVMKALIDEGKLAPKRRGRPPGSKDKKPRKPRTVKPKVDPPAEPEKTDG